MSLPSAQSTKELFGGAITMVGRLSLVVAHAGQREALLRLYRELDATARTQAGFIASILFTDPEKPDEVGRLSLWRSREDADGAASVHHVVNLRSQIHRLINPGHTEKLVDVLHTVNLP